MMSASCDNSSTALTELDLPALFSSPGSLDIRTYFPEGRSLHDHATAILSGIFGGKTDKLFDLFGCYRGRVTQPESGGFKPVFVLLDMAHHELRRFADLAREHGGKVQYWNEKLCETDLTQSSLMIYLRPNGKERPDIDRLTKSLCSIWVDCEKELSKCVESYMRAVEDGLFGVGVVLTAIELANASGSKIIPL